ncbi:MAG: phosphatidylserine decarboxylase family protein [Deltaproteobacteria bacterium]|nr:phosphatidylserine decarboxylase family protein [Deltaproteobacteria bacterium]
MRVPFAREGLRFAVGSAMLGALFLTTGFAVLSVISFFLTLFVVWFFRDPERELPSDPDSIVSPADGRVIKVERIKEERFLGTEALKISIFMNVFNVHVNRAPADGTIERIVYNPGRFFSADMDKASLENEQNALVIRSNNGFAYATNQIAGLIARRIVCKVTEGMTLKKGQRYGMIMFGSRLDVFLPSHVKEKVGIGDRVRAGSSVIALWQGSPTHADPCFRMGTPRGYPGEALQREVG